MDIQEEIQEEIGNIWYRQVMELMAGEVLEIDDREIPNTSWARSSANKVINYLHSRGVVILGKTDYTDETLKLYSYEPLIRE